jgi:hypothetical protein
MTGVPKLQAFADSPRPFQNSGPGSVHQPHFGVAQLGIYVRQDEHVFDVAAAHAGSAYALLLEVRAKRSPSMGQRSGRFPVVGARLGQC